MAARIVPKQIIIIVMTTMMMRIPIMIIIIVVDDDDVNNNNNNNNNNNTDNNDDDDDDDTTTTTTNDNNNNDNNRIERRSARLFLQSPHCTANCLQHVHSSCHRAIVCKSLATHRALITCNMSSATWYQETAQLLGLT